jgi:SLT domain-containing protein
LKAYSRRLDRIPKSKTTKAIVNTTSAETSLTRLGTKATASGKLGLKGLSLIGRGAKIASAGLDLVGGPAGAIMLAVQGLTILYQHNKKFRTFVNGLASSAKSAMGKLGKAFESGAKSAISWTSNMWDRVKKSYQQGQAQTQQQTLQHARQQQQAWNGIKDTTASIAKDMFDKLNVLHGNGLGNMLNGWKDHFSKVISAITSNGSPIHDAFKGLLNGLLSPFANLINGIIKGINWVLDKVGGDSHKLGTFTIDKLANGTPGGGLLHDQVALLNDGSGPNFQEMVHFPSGETVMLPPERNLMMYLPAQTEVLDGERSAKLAPLMGISHYADGAVGDFFSSLWDKGKDVVDFAEDILKKPIGFMESVFKHFVSGKSDNGGFFSVQLHTSLPVFFAKSMADWVKKQFQEMADPAGSGVDRWRPYVVRALDMLHLSSSLVGRVLKQIQTESGGNPKALGGDDGLSDGRAMGLMQVKPPTFAAYKLPGHNNIWNGFDNLLAGLNYARHRYGDSLSFLGQGHGYANGGIATQPSIFGEAGAEMAIPLDSMKSSRAWELMRQVVAYYGGNNATQTTTLDTRNLSQQIQELIEVGKAVLAVNGEQVRAIKGIKGYDKVTAYKQQRIDQTLANYQAF